MNITDEVRNVLDEDEGTRAEERMGRERREAGSIMTQLTSLQLYDDNERSEEGIL